MRSEGARPEELARDEPQLGALARNSSRAFLLLWNTKWPHYLLAPALCVSAAEGVRQLFALAERGLRRFQGRRA